MSEALLSTAPDHASEPHSLRVPPHSVEAEQSVLGGLMLDNQSWDRIADRVIEDDFYHADHRQIFRGIASLAEHNRPFDIVTLSEWLDSHGELEAIGGMAYLGRLANETPTAANIDAYADIIHEHSVKRQLIRVGTDIANTGYIASAVEELEVLMEVSAIKFEELYLDLAVDSNPKKFSDISSIEKIRKKIGTFLENM